MWAYNYRNKRYYILMLYCLCLMFNNIVKVTSELKLDTISKLCDAQPWKLTILAVIYPLVYIPSLIISTIIFNRYNIRVGITFAAIIQGIGSILNGFLNISFDFLIVGQTLWAVAYPMLLSCVACIPALWFEESKRIMTITISWTFVFLGYAIGYIMPQLFVMI